MKTRSTCKQGDQPGIICKAHIGFDIPFSKFAKLRQF